MAMVLSGAGTQVSAPSGWNTEVIASTGDVGWHASIAIDSQNKPHISFADRTIPALKYASWTGSSWSIETVDSGMTIAETSLALDSGDKPHIGYRASDGFRYAHWTGSSWFVDIVDTDGMPGLRVSLALDSDDRPHASYYSSCGEPEPAILRYANKTSASWQVTDLQLVGICDGYDYTSIGLDSKDTPHIAYAGGANDLLYTNWDGDSWNFETVDSHMGTGNFASIAIDSQDQPHISFWSGLDNGLKYAHLAAGFWVTQLLTTDGTGRYTSIALDAEDRPHISYGSRQEFPSFDYLFYTHYVGGLWINETIDTDWVLYETSIALDRCGMPHMAYQAAPSGVDDSDLRHAWKSCTNPLPDLTIQSKDISFLPSDRVGEGTVVTINATVHNDGIVDASDVLVRIFEGDPYFGTQIDGDKTISTIPWGDSGSVEVAWNATSVGTYDICVVVDPENAIVEQSELNNQACTKIDVYISQAPGPPNMLMAYLSGDELENVTLEWSLSPDDLGGLGNVERYDVLRGESYNSNLAGYSPLDSVPSGASSYVDSHAGEGDPDNHFYVACAVSPLGNRSCAGTQAGKFARPLTEGPNLVSIPLVQSDESVEVVLQTVEYDRTWHYDASSHGWQWFMAFKNYRKGLWSVNHTIGLWVNVTRNSNLTVAGLVPAQTIIHLHEGWNLVSFPSFNASFTVYDLKTMGAMRIEGYDFSPPYHLRVLGDGEVLVAGDAYWVRMATDIDWIVGID